MKYNMAAPTRRLGLTRRNNYASLHENAHDRHAGSDMPPASLDPAMDDESLLRPPQESDQESDSVSNSGASTPDDQGSNSTTSTPSWLEKDSTKFFIQKNKPKRGAIYGKGKKMGTTKVIQKARPPRSKVVDDVKFIRPTETKISEETARKFDSEEGFNWNIPDKKTAERANDIEFEHVERPAKQAKVERIVEDRFFPVPGLNGVASAAPALEVSTQQPVVSSQISDINNDIDDVMKRWPSKGVFQDNESNRREKTPEPEFMVPPKLSSIGVTGRSLLDELNADNQSLEIGHPPPSVKEIQSSNISISGSQLVKCAVCSASISQVTMGDFKKKNHLPDSIRLTTRQQDILHKFHSKADVRNLWQERRYPDIDWSRLSERLIRRKPYIYSVIDRTVLSHYVSRLKQEVLYGGRKTAILADERRAGETGARNLGYYGTRGQRAIGDWLLGEFSAQLRKRSKDHDDIKLTGGAGGYIQKILIPEMIQQLIMEDLRDDFDMKREAQVRADAMISMSGDDELCALIESTTKDDQVFSGGDILRAEQRPKSWLARFIAWESAQCGLLLSEEIEDTVTPISSDNES